MKVSLEWLRDYVDLPSSVTPEQIMHDLTLSTVEVEQLEYPGAELDGVVVATITHVEQVPDTRLWLTKVRTGADDDDIRQVVCGAANVRQGMRVALALPGAHVSPKGATTIEVLAREVRGLQSEAVICAANEIGLVGVFPPPDDQSVIELDELDVPDGTPLAAAIGFDDAVFEIDNKSLTNRPDLWGHHGLARELAAIYDVPLKPLPGVALPGEVEDLLGEPDPSFCNRFTATVIEGIQVQRAPLYMRSRLARVGQRAIDFYVDITNYVMFAAGQPSHAYDAQTLSLPMTARFGLPGESVELLDGSQHPAHEALPFIADASNVLAAAGVMGGDASAVTADTRQLFLEMANFDAQTVRGSSVHCGVRSEASARFEKAIDTQRIDVALGFMLHLIAEEQPDSRAVSHQDVVNRATARAEVTVTAGAINRQLGKQFSVPELTRSLTTLGFDVSADGDSLRVVAPTWRSTGDVSIAADIVEEVARLHGYDNFTFVPPRVDLHQVTRSKRVPLDRQVREQMAASGLQEVFTYPWTKTHAGRCRGGDSRGPCAGGAAQSGADLPAHFSGAEPAGGRCVKSASHGAVWAVRSGHCFYRQRRILAPCGCGCGERWCRGVLSAQRCG